MSYILEALKKSEKERKRGSVPDVLTMQESVPEKAPKKSLRHYFILIGLVINVFILLWWLRPWHSDNDRREVKGGVAQHLELPSETGRNNSDIQVRLLPGHEKEEQGIVESGGNSVAPPMSQDETVRARTEAGPAQVMDANRFRKNINDINSKPDEAQIDSRNTETQMPIAPVTDRDHAGPTGNLGNISRGPDVAPSGGDKIFDIKELPRSFRNDLPELAISAYLYAPEPSSRMVTIDGRILHEGQELSDGLKLEEITDEGVVFSYKGYRFRKSMF